LYCVGARVGDDTIVSPEDERTLINAPTPTMVAFTPRECHDARDDE